MAKLSFTNYQSQSSDRSTFPSTSSVNFFTLKNDGDEAIVRILHKSVEDFDICGVHSVDTPNDKLKFCTVNCLRNSMQEPIENCPLCAAKISLSNKIYIHLIQYIMNDKGQLTAQPCIWERSMSYAYTLKSLIEEYGPLTNYVFKIKRSGAPGSRDTRYNIMIANQSAYPASQYPIVENAFDHYSVIGHAVQNKTAQDMIFFLQNQIFPAPTPKTENFSTPDNVVKATNVHTSSMPCYTADTGSVKEISRKFEPVLPDSQQPTPSTQPKIFSPESGQQMPWQQGEEVNTQFTSVSRPRRLY